MCFTYSGVDSFGKNSIEVIDETLPWIMSIRDCSLPNLIVVSLIYWFGEDDNEII